jgi:hypothetical protein
MFAVNSSAICQKIANVSIKKKQFLAKRNEFEQVLCFFQRYAARDKMGVLRTFSLNIPLQHCHDSFIVAQVLSTSPPF